VEEQAPGVFPKTLRNMVMTPLIPSHNTNPLQSGSQ
jgi:hypothetical protein